MGGDGAVDDAAAESKGTGEVNINVRCTADHSEFSVQIILESLVESFNEAIAQKRDISHGQQLLVYKGRVLRNDHRTLKSYDLEDGDTVYLTEPAPAATTNTTGGTNDSTNSTSLTRDLMKIAVMQSPMNNPDIARNLIMSNPEFPHILNDPDILRQTLEAARDPELVREMLRITDTEISNIESSPEGFNMQWRTYVYLMAGTGTQGGQASNRSTNFSSTSSGAIARSSSHNTSPLPNPWTSTRAGCAQNNTTGSTSGGNAQALTALGLDLLDPEGLAGTILDPSLLTQISDILRTAQIIISNSHALIQMLGAYAEQHGTPDLTPYLGPMMQNLEAFQKALLSQLSQQLSTREFGRAIGVQNPMIPSHMSRGPGTGSPAVLNTNSDEPPEQLYATQLSQLQEMGIVSKL